jgi:hypothetical protein
MIGLYLGVLVAASGLLYLVVHGTHGRALVWVILGINLGTLLAVVSGLRLIDSPSPLAKGALLAVVVAQCVFNARLWSKDFFWSGLDVSRLKAKRRGQDDGG